MTMLDSRLAKVIALMRSATIPGERAAAEARARELAAAAGLTLDEAIAAIDPPVAPPFKNIFDGFADFCEAEEPGYKQRWAAEKAEKERLRLERRAAIIARYGSEEAALAPCHREKLLLDAIGDLRKPCKTPHERWTHDVDGYSSIIDRLPARIANLIECAYAMPTTFPAALVEWEYWRARQLEIEDVLGPKQYGDAGLDLIPWIRFDMLRDLVEHVLETPTLRELYDRFKFYRDQECQRDEIEDALFRDLEKIVLTRHLSSPPTAADDARCCEDRTG